MASLKKQVKELKKARAASSKDMTDHVVAETKATVIDTKDKAYDYDIKQGEVHSDTHLEDDIGHGKSIIIRSFDFKANPQAFKERTPSKQELFNAHLKQIEIILWKDGLKIMTDVQPQLMLSKRRDGYRIVVGAEPEKGQIISLRDQGKHQTLSQAAHGRFSGDN